MKLDNPLTRKGYTCPFCYGPKDQGLLACWYCFNRSGLRNGEPHADEAISNFESFLESQERRA
jgi:hypothetical protein